jgi:hypothetical protein
VAVELGVRAHQSRRSWSEIPGRGPQHNAGVWRLTAVDLDLLDLAAATTRVAALLLIAALLILVLLPAALAASSR